MLKKMLKSCLAIAAVCAMSTSAFAAAEIHGFLWSSFGQYNSGVEDTSAYFINSHFAPISINVSGEKLSVYAEIDWMRTGYAGHPAAGPTAAAFDNSGIGPAKITWKATDALDVVIGLFDLPEHKPFSRGSGTIEPLLPAYWGSDTYTHIFDYGLHGRYTISEDMHANFGLLTVESQQAHPGAQIGSGMHASIGGKAGAIEYRAAYLSSKADDWNDPDDDAVNSSGMMVSGQYTMGTMKFNLGYHSKSVGDDMKGSIMDLQFVGNKLGPGNLIVTYASETITDSPRGDYGTIWTDLLYAYPLAPGENLNFMYLSKGVTPDGGDTTTETFMGAGWVKFF
jgi:hypothetical protein